MALTDKIKAIADAIRAKTGSTDTMTLAEMPSAISGIQSGGGDEELITALKVAYEGVPEDGVLIIPEGITSIRAYGWAYCDDLLRVEGSSGITIINEFAFRSAYNLETAEFRDGLLSIGQHAFANCTNLTNVILPDSVEVIDTQAFYQCSRLTLSMLPKNLITLGMNALYGCNNASIHSLPDKLEVISENSLRRIIAADHLTIPASVKSIGGWALADSASMIGVTFLGTPTSLDDKTFGNSNTVIITINVPWAEGEVANAPWGATNATINYNYTGE